MSNGYRTLSQHLNDLKKENFSLKLRIYFLEERIQQKYEDSSEDVYKRNIELKVEVESLKRELQEKQQFLDKTWAAAENLTSYNEAELRRQYEQKQEETEQVQELLENKIQLLQEETRLAKSEADRMLALAEAEKEKCLELRNTIKEFAMEMTEARVLQKNYCATLTEKDRMIQQLTQVLDSKDSFINQLTEEKQRLLDQQVKSLEQAVQDLKTSLHQKDYEVKQLEDDKLRTQQEMRNLIEKQQQDVNEHQAASGEHVSQLQSGKLQLQTVQCRLQETEASNKMLQENLHQRAGELNSAREAMQTQDHVIQSLRETLQSRESEVEELYHVIEGHNDTIAKLREMLQRSQSEHVQVTPSQLQLLDLQNTLFCTQMELQKQQRGLRQKERQMTDAMRSQRFLEADLLEGQQQKETTWKHNQELHGALHKLQAELQDKSQQLRNLEEEKCTKLHAQEQSVQRLKQTLSQKEQLLQEYMDLLEYQQSLEKCPGGNDHVLEKLRQRIKDRDAALERAVDDKFCSLEEKEKEMQQLKLITRDKERDLDRLRSVLSGNKETINSLDNLMKGKDLELEQISAAYKNLQWLKQETEEKYSRSLMERETITQQLQSALQERGKEVEEMAACFLRSPELGSSELMQELHVCLQQKEKMLQEALHGRSQQAAEHEREIQELLTTIASEKMDQAVVCRNCMLKEQQTFGMEALDQSVDVSCLQILLQEKDQIIQELTQAEAPSDHPISVSMKHSCENMKAADIYTAVNVEKTHALENNLAKANDELQLVLRKEREKQLELSGLQSIVMKQSEQLQEQAADMETLSRSVQIKEDLIKDLQMQLVDPEEVPTVERLIQEVITLKEKVASMEIFGQSHSGDRSQKLSELLEVLAADRNRLNEALETEKQLYSSLVQFHTDPDSFQNSSALQAELLAAQSLRGQLEETLGRATERLTQLESESRSPAVIFGGLNEDEEEEDSSSQFTDSIEDEADVHATLGRAEQQNVVNSSDSCFELEENVASAQNVVSEKRLQNELLQLRCELHQVTAQKTKAEEELCVLKAKLKEAGIFSTADIRNVLQHLCPEKEELEVEMESATLGQREDEKMEEEGSVEEGLRVEIRKLQGKMGQAETVIKHLKEQLALNFRDGEGAFNPDLIVSMAKEIERLKMETASTPMKRSALGGQPREDMSKRRCSRPWSVYVGEFEKPSIKQEPSFALTSATRPGNCSPHTDDILEEQTLHLRSELAHNIRQNQELQDKLVVSEATVHAQTDQLEQYRVLLNEPLVEQNNKQVQVDLQDLGYETCGRSENEGDREETTSPEYDEPEDIFSEASLMEELTSPYKSWGPLVTSSPLKNKACLLNDWTIDWEKSEDITVLQQHVKDLKVQLQKSQKIIRSLHSRARTLSASSDCASSQHRLKHSVSFHGSTSHSITDEDEGWQSDTVGVHSTKGLEQLVQRVSVLEAQLHQPRRDGGVKDQMRSATGPGKYDSLIQAQARELSLLRQKLREGRDVGHILSQHLSDTIKSFEELLRANDVDYYMGQGFREQLAQGSQMTERLNSKLNSKERLEVDDKSRHELLALRLSKELQQKDKIIESLQSKLEERSVTPSSSHAISESDQSDRTSFVSDDQLSTNDDLDVCSEVATASDYTQYEQGRTQREDTIIHKDIVVALPSKSSLPTSHEAQPQSKHHLNASSSLIHATDTVQSLKGMPLITPAVKPAHASSCFFDANTTSSPFAPSYFPHNSHNSSKATAVQANTDLRTAGTGLPNTSALWDMSHLARPINTNVFGDASSGSSGYQSGSKLSGSGLLEEHLTEIRNLHQRLEESIHTNDRLREQLEERLTAAARGNGLESLSQLSKENRALREENVSLQVRMSQISRDYFTELEQLRELLNASRSRLKDAELSLEQQKQESQRLHEELEEKHQEILQLQKERQSNQEKSNRLQHQATLLDQQLNENRQLLHTLQSELQVYERLYGSSKLVLSAFSGETYHTLPANYDFSELLSEVRSLRTQMEQSIQVNNSIRHHLEKQLEGDTRTAEKRPSSINIFTSCQNGAKRQLFQGVSDTSAAVENNSQKLEGEAPDGSFANKNGRHVIGHIDDFGALKQQILEGKMLIHKMESLMQSSLNVPFLEIHGTKALNYGSIKTLFSTTSTLHQILEETTSLLTMFWRAALPNTQGVAQQKEEAQAMKDEICQLRNKVKEQENVLQEAAEQMKSTNRAKESMEQFIVSQLTRTHDVLTKAKSNLEKNNPRISSVKSHCPSSKGQMQQRTSKSHSHLMSVFQEPPRKRSQLKSMKRQEEWTCRGFFQASQY
ncbi:hypothetical protein FKM82_002272 [Ascaphus truei]